MSRYIWTAIHATAAVSWGWLAATIVWEVFTTGNLIRHGNPTGFYDTRTAFWMLALFAVSAISAARAIWNEDRWS